MLWTTPGQLILLCEAAPLPCQSFLNLHRWTKILRKVRKKCLEQVQLIVVEECFVFFVLIQMWWVSKFCARFSIFSIFVFRSFALKKVDTTLHNFWRKMIDSLTFCTVPAETFDQNCSTIIQVLVQLCLHRRPACIGSGLVAWCKFCSIITNFDVPSAPRGFCETEELEKMKQIWMTETSSVPEILIVSKTEFDRNFNRYRNLDSQKCWFLPNFVRDWNFDHLKKSRYLEEFDL